MIVRFVISFTSHADQIAESAYENNRSKHKQNEGQTMYHILTFLSNLVHIIWTTSGGTFTAAIQTIYNTRIIRSSFESFCKVHMAEIRKFHQMSYAVDSKSILIDSLKDIRLVWRVVVFKYSKHRGYALSFDTLLFEAHYYNSVKLNSVLCVLRASWFVIKRSSIHR